MASFIGQKEKVNPGAVLFVIKGFAKFIFKNRDKLNDIGIPDTDYDNFTRYLSLTSTEQEIKLNPIQSAQAQAVQAQAAVAHAQFQASKEAEIRTKAREAAKAAAKEAEKLAEAAEKESLSESGKLSAIMNRNSSSKRTNHKSTS